MQQQDTIEGPEPRNEQRPPGATTPSGCVGMGTLTGPGPTLSVPANTISTDPGAFLALIHSLWHCQGFNKLLMGRAAVLERGGGFWGAFVPIFRAFGAVVARAVCTPAPLYQELLPTNLSRALESLKTETGTVGESPHT